MPAEPPAALSWQRLRRLPGRSPSVRTSRMEGSARLWIDDHNLVQETVKSHLQEVHRFALNDIQAIQVRRTVRGLVYNLILCALLALPLIGLITQLASERPDTGGVISLAIIGGVFGLLLLANTLRGPTCRTVLTTALGPQLLPSLSRMPTARRALDVIVPRIEAIQGALPPDEAIRQVDRARTPAASAAPSPKQPGYDY